MLGTIDYVAPEQVEGGQVDGRADQYSLGCALFECLTGRLPFEKDLDAAIIWAHVEEMPPMPSALRPGLPPGVDDVFAKVLAKKAADRYPSCREFVEAARGALAGYAVEGGVAQPPTVQAHRQPPDPPVIDTSPPADLDRRARRRGGPAGPRAAGQNASLRRMSGRRWAAALSVLAVVAAAGVGSWLALHGGSPGSAANGGGPSSPAAAGPRNHLLQLIEQTNTKPEAKGLLPPKTCHLHGMTRVTCLNPDPPLGITSVTFQTYPSLKALYAAYESTVKPLNSGHFRANYGECKLHQNIGEVSWNHSFQHPKTYSIKQSASGTIPLNKAAGRAFCTFTNTSYSIVWTQNDQRLLVRETTTDHEGAFKWWVAIHHNIPEGSGSNMHM